MLNANPLLIDITGLLNEAKKKQHIPKGIERVAYAYLKHYQHRAHAVVYINKYFYRRFLILPFEMSQNFFDGLLNPSKKFFLQIPGYFLKAIFYNFINSLNKKFKNCFILKLDYSLVRFKIYKKWIEALHLKPVFMIYDLIPIKYPEYFVQNTYKNHIVMLEKMISMAAGLITDSDAVLEELKSYAKPIKQEMPPAISALLAPGRKIIQAGVRPIKKPYFVVLGTIEPRKNHLLLLQIWRHLIEKYADVTPQLVVIGQRGWKCEQVLDLLDRCQQLKGFVIEHAASDAEVVTYLHYAQALLFPTFAEGFGLPLIEALAQGIPVIASDLAVFRESAGEIPEYLDPLDGMAWLEMIVEYSHPASVRREQQLQRLTMFKIPTWEQHFAKVDIFLEQLNEVCLT